MDSFKVAATAGGSAITLTADTDPTSPAVVGKVLTAATGDTLTLSPAVRGTELDQGADGLRYPLKAAYFGL